MWLLIVQRSNGLSVSREELRHVRWGCARPDSRFGVTSSAVDPDLGTPLRDFDACRRPAQHLRSQPRPDRYSGGEGTIRGQGPRVVPRRGRRVPRDQVGGDQEAPRKDLLRDVTAHLTQPARLEARRRNHFAAAPTGRRTRDGTEGGELLSLMAFLLFRKGLRVAGSHRIRAPPPSDQIFQF